MGLIGGIIQAGWTGYHLVLMEPKHFVQRPLRWLQAMDAYRCEFSGGANFAYDLCVNAADGTERFDLSRWRLAFSGAEPVQAATLRRFAARFAGNGFRAGAFFPCYGLAEATLMATAPDPGTPRPVFWEEADHGEPGPTRVGCGRPCPQTTILIVDPKTRTPRPEGEAGEIWITGPGLFDGYWRGPGKRLRRPQRTLSGQTDPVRYFPTGDIGRLHGGELFVTGRLKDLIILRGKNYGPSDIEEAAAGSHPSLASSGAAAFGAAASDPDGTTNERLVVVCEAAREARRRPDWTDVTFAVRAAVTQAIGAAPDVVQILPPGALARTTSGKLQRYACKTAYLAGSWTVLAQQTGPVRRTGAATRVDETPTARRAALEPWLIERLAALRAAPAAFLSQRTMLAEIGLDSIKRVELALTLEEALELALPLDAFEEEMTIGELIGLIETAIAAEEAGPRRDEEPDRQPAGSAEDAPAAPVGPWQAHFLSASVDRPEDFTQTLMLRTPTGVSGDAVRTALEALTDRFEAFQIVFRRVDDDWTAVRGARSGDGTAHPGIAYERLDLRTADRSPTADLKRETRQRLLSGIDPQNGPMAKALLADAGPTARSVLMIAFHHLIVDGVSLSLFVKRFESAYRRALAGDAPPTPGASDGWTRWLRALDAHCRGLDAPARVAYWRAVCGPDNAGAVHPAPRDATRLWRFASRDGLGEAQSRRLAALHPRGADRVALFVAAISWAWRDVLNAPPPLVLVENHGRARLGGVDPARLIGWFAAKHPVRVGAATQETPAAFIEDILAQLHAIEHSGLDYGLLRHRHPDPAVRAAMAALPAPEVFLPYRGALDAVFRANDLFPVIGVETERGALDRAESAHGARIRLQAEAGFANGAFYIALGSRGAFYDDQIDALRRAAAAFLAAASTGLG